MAMLRNLQAVKDVAYQYLPRVTPDNVRQMASVVTDEFMNLQRANGEAVEDPRSIFGAAMSYFEFQKNYIRGQTTPRAPRPEGQRPQEIYGMANRARMR